MDVRMIIEFLTPCMKYLDDAGSSAEEFGISGEFQESLGRDFMEEGVKGLLIHQEELIKIMRHGENHMEVPGVDDFRSSFINPDLFKDSLTVWTVTVPA